MSQAITCPPTASSITLKPQNPKRETQIYPGEGVKVQGPPRRERRQGLRRYTSMTDSGSIRLSDGEEDPQARTPWVSLVLAYAAMVPIVAGSLAAWVWPEDGLAAELTTAWAGGVLCFLAGARRGLSFRQEGGPTLAQLAAMLWLFALGVGSLLSPWLVPALALQIAGFATAAVLDPIGRGDERRHATSRG